MTTKNKPVGNDMTEKGTVQLSMNIDPDLKTRIKLTAIKNNMTMTEWVLKWVDVGLKEDSHPNKPG